MLQEVNNMLFAIQCTYFLTFSQCKEMAATPLVVIKTIARIGRDLFLTKDLEAHHLLVILLRSNIATELEKNSHFQAPNFVFLWFPNHQLGSL